MPPKKRSLIVSKSQQRMKNARSSETTEQYVSRLEYDRSRKAQHRSSISNSHPESTSLFTNIPSVSTENNDSDYRRLHRLETVRDQTIIARSNETLDQRSTRLISNRTRNIRSRQSLHGDLNLAAFNYEVDNDYSIHPGIVIGKMDNVCEYCQALKFKTETPGMCCASGKVNLPAFRVLPEPLSNLLAGVSNMSKHYLSNIRHYNACFQMHMKKFEAKSRL